MFWRIHIAAFRQSLVYLYRKYIGYEWNESIVSAMSTVHASPLGNQSHCKRYIYPITTMDCCLSQPLVCPNYKQPPIAGHSQHTDKLPQPNSVVYT